MISTHRPLVSIIIPCYKAEKELPQALESISKQSYTHWEVVAVNDGWQDGTDEIIENFRKLHPGKNINYLKHPKNRGLGATRNTGIQNSHGELIAFLDHDDLWEKDHLSHATEAFKNESCDIWYSPVMVFDSNGKTNDWVWGPTPEDLNHFPDSLFERNFIQPSAVVISKSFLDHLGLMDTDPEIHFCEDHELWIRAASINGKFTHSKEVTVRYRYNNPNAATSKILLMLKNDLAVQKKHFQSKGFSKTVKCNAIANNYRRLGNYFWESDHILSLFYLGKSLYWQPKELQNLKQFLKGLIYWPSTYKKLKRA